MKALRDQVEKGSSSGMQIFEQSLLKLYEDNIITEEVALAEADSPANLRMAMRQNRISKFSDPSEDRRSVENIGKLQF